jgi:hypothetical protein
MGLPFTIAAGLASGFILGSESRGTSDHILLSQIRNFPFCRLLRLVGLRWGYSTPPSQGRSPLSCLRSSLYSLEMATTENTISQQFLYCYRGAFTSTLHTNGSSFIVACVFISAGTYLPSCCLAMNVYSGSAIPPFRAHKTIYNNY